MFFVYVLFIFCDLVFCSDLFGVKNIYMYRKFSI